MDELVLKSTIQVADFAELSAEEQALVNKAIESTNRSYAVYSHFHVGAAVLLKNGETVVGCNQENVSFSAGICAERSALSSAGANYPDEAVTMMAIAARRPDGELQETPISPCGICRQVILETEMRYRQPIRILLYGTEKTYIVNGIKDLMPLSFTDF